MMKRDCHSHHHHHHLHHHHEDMLLLDQVKEGDEVVLIKFRARRLFRKRMADLGLNVGDTVRVVKAGGHGGPMIVAIKNDARLALGRGLTHKIIVRKS